MSRPDFRSNNQIRPPSCSLGDVTEANGSCSFAQGNTEALASVYGPTEPRFSHHEKYDEAFLHVDFSISGSARTAALGGSSTGGNVVISRIEKSSARFLKDSLLGCLNLQDHPRRMILIKVCVLRDDGAMLSVALNAAALALQDSGLSMLFLPNSVTVFYPMESFEKESENNVLEHGECSLDPTKEEEAVCGAMLIFTLNPSEPFSVLKKSIVKEEKETKINNNEKIENEKFRIIHMVGSGNFDLENLNESVILAKKASLVLHEFVRKVVQDKMKIGA